MKKYSFWFLLSLLLCISLACNLSLPANKLPTPVPTSSGSVILPPTAIAKTGIQNFGTESGSESVLNSSEIPSPETSLPSQDTVFLEDTFDNSSSGWPNKITADWTGVYENNEYHMVAENSFSYMESWASDTSYQNYSIESDIRFLDQSIENAGCLLIRYSGFNKFYTYCLRPDGSYNFVRYLYNQIDFLLGEPWPISEVFKPGGDPNYLKAIVNFNEFTLILNDTYLDSVRNNDYVGGYAGYSVNRFNNSSRSEAVFDNFKISGPAQDFNQPAPYQPFQMQYNEIFDNPYSGWPQLNDGSISMGYRDGYYAITTGKKLTVVRPNQIAHQPVLGTYVTPQDLPEDVEVFYGVLCGLSYDYNNDSLNGFGGAVSNFGNFGIFSFVGKDVKPLILENDPLVYNNGDMIQVQLTCLDDIIYLGTGGGITRNLNVPARVSPYGEIGFFIFMPDKSTEVSVHINQVYFEQFSSPDGQ